MTKLDRLAENSDSYVLVEEARGKIQGGLISKTYRITDKSLISFRSGKATRTMTEEQKEAARQRLAEARKRREKEEEGGLPGSGGTA